VSTEGIEQENISVQPWDPGRVLRSAGAREVQLSRGFLRCRPERWLPGFSTHWLPLAHSLSSEARIVEVKPTATLPAGLEFGFVASVDGEPFSVAVDAVTAGALGEEVIPGGTREAQDAVLEYLARRLVASLALSWSGPESSTVQFESGTTPESIPVSGAIRINCVLNTTQFSIWLGLGRRLVERLDGLWRRQVQSTSRIQPGTYDLSLELVQLGVPPQMLADYLRRDTLIDLEIGVTDSLVLRTNGKPWLPGRLLAVDRSFACETAAGAVPGQELPDGMTRLSVQLGTLQVEHTQLAEIAQVGSMLLTGLPLTDKVDLAINNEKVGEATLCTYEGRFAMSVL
jgi:hypothetical protein